MRNGLYHNMRTKIKTLKLFSLIAFVLSTGCNKETSTSPANSVSEFTQEKEVTIIGYTGNAMEPFITKDEQYLFFNNLQGANSKDIYYAKKIDNTNFEFKGEIQGVNTSYVDANPTMDALNNFYFISTRDLANGNKTIYGGIFNNGIVSNLHQISGTINISTPYWINMGVEVSKNGNILFVSNAKFNTDEIFPSEGDIRFAIKNDNEYNIPDNEEDILANINTDSAIEYAGELSADELELFYSQVTLSNPPVFKLYYAKREQANGVFGNPISITEPFEKNEYAIVEAPSLSGDGKRLYYHKLNSNGIYSIFMLSRE